MEILIKINYNNFLKKLNSELSESDLISLHKLIPIIIVDLNKKKHQSNQDQLIALLIACCKITKNYIYDINNLMVIHNLYDTVGLVINNNNN